MSKVFFNANTPAITPGAVAQTMLQIAAPANQRVLVHEIAISFQGISTTDTPILVEVLRQTTAGTMSSLTPVKNNNGDDETIQTTAQHTATVEPTGGDVLASRYVHPQSHFIFYLPEPIVVKGGGRLGVRVTCGTSIASTIVNAKCEE